VLSLYVVNGITAIRGMLGDASHVALRAKLANGEKLGPRLVTSGPSFNNNSVRTPQAGIDIRNTARIEGVMLGGRWMPKRDIAIMLAALRM